MTPALAAIAAARGPRIEGPHLPAAGAVCVACGLPWAIHPGAGCATTLEVSE